MDTREGITSTTYPDRPSWLRARRLSLGASDSPKVIGLSRFGTPLSVYADKRGLVTEDAGASEAAEWGLLLEPLVAARYARETGLELHDPGAFTIVRNEQFPFLHFSPDRYVLHPERGLGLLSIKTASAFKAEEWQEEAPLAYQVQCQHELLVADLRWAAVAVLIGGQTFRYVECIERDDTFCDRLVPTLLDFWTSVMLQQAPPVDASEACREALRRLYPKEEKGKVVPLPQELIDVDELWIQAQEELAHWETQKLLAENTVRKALGDAEKGVLPNGIAWTSKTQHRKSYTVEAADFRVLRRSKKG
jgi:putative phage-type endonuclease